MSQPSRAADPRARLLVIQEVTEWTGLSPPGKRYSAASLHPRTLTRSAGITSNPLSTFQTLSWMQELSTRPLPQTAPQEHPSAPPLQGAVCPRSCPPCSEAAHYICTRTHTHNRDTHALSTPSQVQV